MWDCVSCQAGRDSKSGRRRASYKTRGACTYIVTGPGKQTRTLTSSAELEEFYRTRSSELWQEHHRLCKSAPTPAGRADLTSKCVEEEQRRSLRYLSNLSYKSRPRLSKSQKQLEGGTPSEETPCGSFATLSGGCQQPAQVIGTVSYPQSSPSSPTNDYTDLISDATCQLTGPISGAAASPRSASLTQDESCVPQTTESSVPVAASMGSHSPSFYHETQAIAIAALEAMSYQWVADEVSQ